MCDYSLEGYPSVKAKAGEKYVLDGNYTHGFMTVAPKARTDIVMACVAHGQKLQLTKAKLRPDFLTPAGRKLPSTCTVTVVNRKKDMHKYATLGPYNDGIETDDGWFFPIAWLKHAEMEVVEAKPKTKRNLIKALGLDKLKKAKTATKAKKARELVDGDD